MRRLPGVPVAAFALLLVLSCRQIVGIEDQPAGSGGASTFLWNPSACAACMQTSCETPADSCRGDAVCDAAFDCLARCAGADEACRSACVALPDEDDAMAALASCQARACATECGLQCGGERAFGGPWPIVTDADPRTACRQCAESKPFCDALGAVAECPDCLAWRFCASRCVGGAFDTICTNNCFAQYPMPLSSSADSGLLGELSSCVSDCPPGTNWDCLGHVRWQVAKSSEVTFSIQVTSITNGAPIPRAQVLPCSMTSPTECISSAPGAQTDMNGIATLTLPPPFDGYFDIQAPNFVHELFVFTPTITESMLPGTGTGANMLPSDQLASLVAEVGVPMPDTKSLGVLFVAPSDCGGQWAPNVSFTGTSLGTSAAPYYFVGGALDGQATATARGAPGDLVGGGWIQVAPGVVAVTATVVGGGTFATQSMPTQAGAITVGIISPTPTP